MADNSLDKTTDLQQNLFESADLPSAKKYPTGYAVMNCDGASSGNPGRAGIGVLIKIADEDVRNLGMHETYEIADYIGIATNNVAEYSALIAGLEKANSLGLKKLKIFLDSELIVRQINGIYKVKNKNLLPLFNKVMRWLKKLDSFKVAHVRREYNQEADALARQGVKKAGG